MREKILQWILSLSEGDYTLDDHIHARRLNEFTQELKNIISGGVPGVDVTFSSDYRKIRIVKTTPEEKVQRGEDWSEELDDHERFFGSVGLPPEPYKMNGATTIHSIKRMVDGHLAVLRRHNGNKHFEPHLIRVRQLREQVERNPGSIS